jgi:uncharacterized membrane protein (DUF106 family)
MMSIQSKLDLLRGTLQFFSTHHCMDPVIIVVGFALAVALFVELANWALVYRTPKFIAMRDQIDKLNSELEAHVEVGLQTPAAQATESRLREQISKQMRELSRQKFKTGILLSVIMFASSRAMRRRFQGVIVAELPFQPIKIVARILRRGLDAEAPPTAVSYSGLYWLCTMSLRRILTRTLGFMPRTPSVAEQARAMPNPFEAKRR